MSMQIGYGTAGPGANNIRNRDAGTIVQAVRNAIRRRAELSRLHTLHVRMCAVSAHTLKDIGIDRNVLITVTRPASVSCETVSGSPGNSNDRD